MTACANTQRKWVKNLFGQAISIDPFDAIGKEMLKKGLHDSAGLFYIKKVLNSFENPIVFDVGSNIGNHTLAMSQWCHKVYSFEPQIEVGKVCRLNCETNNLNNYEFFNFGLSNKDADLDFFESLDGNNGGSTFVDHADLSTYRRSVLPVRCGDTVVDEYRIPYVNFIKMDVEGFEGDAIIGLEATIRKHRPILSLEWCQDRVREVFAEHGLYDSLFRDYICRGLVCNLDEPLEPGRPLKGARRIIKKCLRGKEWSFADFKKEFSYSHVFFIPREKAHLIDLLVPVFEKDTLKIG